MQIYEVRSEFKQSVTGRKWLVAYIPSLGVLD